MSPASSRRWPSALPWSLSCQVARSSTSSPSSGEPEGHAGWALRPRARSRTGEHRVMDAVAQWEEAVASAATAVARAAPPGLEIEMKRLTLVLHSRRAPETLQWARQWAAERASSSGIGCPAWTSLGRTATAGARLTRARWSKSSPPRSALCAFLATTSATCPRSARCGACVLRARPQSPSASRAPNNPTS